MLRNQADSLPKRFADRESRHDRGRKLAGAVRDSRRRSGLRDEPGTRRRTLADAYGSSLALAAENGLQSIAFPSISTGAFHYPKHEAARISSQIIKEFLEQNVQINEARLVFFSEADARVFLKHQKFK
jgi:O-acetyl-ADP-ribose deacetylase (regulator of RNase III)